MKAFVSVILLICSLVAMIGLNKSLRCYECNVKGENRDSECEIIDPARSDYLIECPESAKKCGTIVTYGYGDDPDITSRGCLDSAEAKKCDQLDEVDVSCEACDTDECNIVPVDTIG